MTNIPLESKHIFSHCASVGYSILNTEDSRNGSKLLTKICDLKCIRKKIIGLGGNQSMKRIWGSLLHVDHGPPRASVPLQTGFLTMSAFLERIVT